MTGELPWHERRVFVEWHIDGKPVEWRRLRTRLELKAALRAKEARIVEAVRPVTCPIHGEPLPFLLIVEGDRARPVQHVELAPGDACCPRFYSKVIAAVWRADPPIVD